MIRSIFEGTATLEEPSLEVRLQGGREQVIMRSRTTNILAAFAVSAEGSGVGAPMTAEAETGRGRGYLGGHITVNGNFHHPIHSKQNVPRQSPSGLSRPRILRCHHCHTRRTLFIWRPSSHDCQYLALPTFQGLCLRIPVTRSAVARAVEIDNEGDGKNCKQKIDEH